VARGAIDDFAVHGVLAVVDRDGPEVHKGEDANVCELLHGEEEGEDVVRDALCEAVEWMEGVGCEWRRDNPLMVRLVEVLVDALVVQAAVDPVNEAIREGDEEWELQDIVPQPGPVGGGIVHFGVAADFEEEGGDGEEGHERHGVAGGFDFEEDLAFEVFGVLEVGFVEDEVVGEGCEDEVEDVGEYSVGDGSVRVWCAT